MIDWKKTGLNCICAKQFGRCANGLRAGDGIEVTNNNWFTVYHPEGLVSWVYSPFEETHPSYLPPAFQYEVMCRDHLGNVRATVSQKAVGDTY